MAGNNNMHNFTTLIKRLEAATSRLEDMAGAFVPETPHTNGSSAAHNEDASRSPATAASSAAQPATPAPTPAPAPEKPTAEPIPQFVEDFDDFIARSIQKYVELSKGVDAAVGDQAGRVLEAFQAQRKFLLISTRAKKPDMTSSAYADLLAPLQQHMQAISDIRDRNRGKPHFNHLSTVSESISVLAWITVEPKPFKHVEESLGSAQYWGNRVVKEFKEKDPKQVEWVQSYYQVFRDLTEYVKDSFPHGILWNAKGVSAAEAAKALESDATSSAPVAAPAPATGGPPPPPPPPPGPAPKIEIDQKPAPPASGAGGGLGAVFSELNKGEAVTKGLKKVDPSEMTHKNPSLRAGATVPQRSDSQSSVSSVSRGKSPAPGKKPKPESMRVKKPPRKELDGNKWIVENYDNESQPVEIEVSISHSILISRCAKTTIIVKGKANAISVDNSPRLSLLVDSLVSSVDVIKSPNFAMQVTGSLPTILMDSVDGAQIYLGKDSMHTEVYASKCSSVNLNLVDGEEGDFKEVPLPEQIRTYINKEGKVVSEIVEHAG